MSTGASSTSTCTASYKQLASWPGGFLGSVTVTNNGAGSATGWTVRLNLASGQSLVSVWNGKNSGKTGSATVTNAFYNGALDVGGTQLFGFIATGSGAVTVDGCTIKASAGGSSSPPTTRAESSTPAKTSPMAPATSASPTSPVSTQAGGTTLPSAFQWSSSGALMSPKPDSSHTEAGLKDPSVVYYGGKWHVFSSVATGSGYNLEYRSFTDWSEASSATPYFLDGSPIGKGYRAAPQVFYFAPQKLWYLVYQTGNASYSTNSDISNPAGWSAPKNFYSGTPAIVSQNIGSGYWVDMWVICDNTNCHLFSSDDNGHLYRSQTAVADFPNGMSQPVIALQDSNSHNLFEASNVYKVDGSDRYLLLVEAIGSRGRYFRSWTSSSLGGSWTPLAASESSPFAGAANVTFTGSAWTNDISHGEAIRSGHDQTLAISPCKMRFLYQGVAPGSNGDYNSLPWRLGLLTQTNSTCS